MEFATADERREYFRELGRRGGQATVAKHGPEHMREIGRRGFEVTTKRHFQGSKALHKRWLVECGTWAYWNDTQLKMKRDFDGRSIWPENKPEHPAHENWTAF